MFKHILISTDGSPVSNKAAKAGVALAKALGAEVTTYCAIEPQQPVYAAGHEFDQKLIEAIEGGARKEGQKRVDAIGKIAKAGGVPFASMVTKANTPYEGIIDAAKKRKYDAIFMASHGRRGLSRLIIGSVTQKVLPQSMIPVVGYRRATADAVATEKCRSTTLKSLRKEYSMQTEHLKVTGMTCGGCVSSITQVLKAVSGVSDVIVSLATGEATVKFDEQLTSPEQLKSAVKGAGYGVDGLSAAQRHQGKGSCCG